MNHQHPGERLAIVVPTVPSVAFAALVCVAPAFAATIRVPADHPTVQAAVDAAVAGDVVQIAKGRYSGAVVIDGKTGITLKGKGKPVLDAQQAEAPVIEVRDSSGILLDGLVLENSASRGVVVTGSSDVGIQRCAVRRVSGDGIRLEETAEAGVVTKNRIDDVGDDGISVAGERHRVEKNRIRRADDDGIDITGSDNVVAKNRISVTGDEGMQLDGDRNRIEKNRISGADADGIDVEGSDNTIVGNKVTRSASDGIEVEESPENERFATRNVFEGNRVTRSGDYGFKVETGGNTFRRNKASKNGDGDLLDESGTGTNVYEGNKFKRQEIL